MRIGFILPVLGALQFLTVIPVHLPRALTATEQARALLCYPMVGVGIGVGMAALGWLLDALLPAMPAAALLLAFWVGVTGALHLDGLADTADAWLGGHGDRARTLAIMRDTHSGAAAVAAVALLLLLKFAALVSLLAAGWWWVLAVAPVVGRAAMPLLLSALPYVREDGIGTDAARLLAPMHGAQVAVLSLAAVLAMVAWLAGWLAALVMIALPLSMLAIWARALRHRLGGTTGDTAGAALEMVEAAVLVAACLSLDV